MAPLLCLLRGGPDSDLCAPSYVARVGNTPPMTLADHQRAAKAFYASFPDLQHMVEETVADNEKVAVLFTLRGTQSGHYMGLPPTQKPFAKLARMSPGISRS